MTLKEKLAEAEEKYHLLMCGLSQREYVDQNGERVVYVAANRHFLAVYIRDLKSQIANKSGASEHTVCFPVRITF